MTQHAEIGRTVVSNATATVNGEPIRTAGYITTVQIDAPTTALSGIQVSHDAVNWSAAHYKNGTALTTVADGLYVVDERANWMRPIVAADTKTTGQNFEFIFSAFKEV